MQRHGSHILLSATDLVTFHECEHASALDLVALDDADLRAQRTEADETGQLFMRRGNEFEARHLAELKTRHPDLVEIRRDGADASVRAEETLAALKRGAPIVYQATLIDGDLIGHADFLQRVERPSSLGPWSYEVIDTKLGRRAKAGYVLQLAFYGELLAKLQGLEPQSMHVVLGNKKQVTYAHSEYSRYLRRLLGRFRAALGRKPETTYPNPCERCATCGWRERCEKKREADDSLFLVSSIRTSQVQKLEKAGIRTLAQLGRLSAEQTIPQMVPQSLARLREQAEMQLRGRETGELVHRLVTLPPHEPRGLACLPPPDEGDVYFDMEGDPLVDGGMEYLFGVLYRDDGAWVFKPFWGHDRAGERKAFEAFMDWLAARIGEYPCLHVYHYAAYEDSALKRLSGRHSTREGMLDQLLRERRLVDLYKVVREGIRASTASYSIKDIERFYREARQGDVQTAGASIVHYERYLETREQNLLEDIERYNEDDVRSLQQLHEWLLHQRPPGMPWRGDEHDESEIGGGGGGPVGLPSARLQGYLDSVEAIRKPLLANLPPDPLQWNSSQRARALMADLLEFHRRCEKPQWWEMFSRADLSFDELLESVDAVAGLHRVHGHVRRVRISAAGNQVRGRRLCRLARASRSREGPPARGRRGTTSRAAQEHCEEWAIARGAERRQGRPDPDAGPQGCPAARRPKRCRRRSPLSRPGSVLRKEDTDSSSAAQPARPIVANPNAPLADIVAAVQALDNSYLFIQGPPGAGKTYTGSHVIAALLAQGKRVAVSSNSHKAINNLLQAVEDVLLENGQADVRAAKKSSSQDKTSYLNGTPDRRHRRQRRGHERALAVARRHRVAVRTTRHGPEIRLPVRRRGRTDLAGAPGRDGRLRTQPRAAGRPDAIGSTDPGRASGALRRIVAGIPARR